MDLLSGADDLEHLVLADAADLGEGHGELGGLLGALVLDGGAEGLSLGRVGAVEQVVGQRGLGVVLGGRLDVALLVGLDLLAHLDLLLVPLRLVQLRPQTPQVLRVLGRLVAFSRFALPCPLLVVETAAVGLAEPLHVLILRLSWAVCLVLWEVDLSLGKKKKKKKKKKRGGILPWRMDLPSRGSCGLARKGSLGSNSGFQYQANGQLEIILYRIVLRCR